MLLSIFEYIVRNALLRWWGDGWHPRQAARTTQDRLWSDVAVREHATGRSVVGRAAGANSGCGSAGALLVPQQRLLDAAADDVGIAQRRIVCAPVDVRLSLATVALNAPALRSQATAGNVGAQIVSVLIRILVVVPVPADPEEPPEGEPELALTDEQREKLRRSMEGLSRAIAPIDFKFQNLISPAFTKLATDMGKLPSFALPESVLKGFTATAAIAEAARPAHLAVTNAMKPVLDAQASSIAASLKPFLDQQALLTKQFSVINSDLFKTAALAQQSTLNSIAAQLVKNADFGLSGAFTELAKQLAVQQSSWLKNLGPTLAGLKATFYPPNLRDVEGLRFEEVEQVVMVDGIALYAVPRASLAEALIRAEGAARRRDILGRRWKVIAADCREAVVGCSTDTVAPYASVTIAALDALEAGHVLAAQALTGSLLDAIVNTYFGKDRHLYTPDKRGKRTNAAYDEFGAREYIAFAPVWQAWQKFFPDEGLPVPHTFSRNATAHTVSSKQYNRRNAVQGLMIVGGILVFLDEQAARLESKRRN